MLTLWCVWQSLSIAHETPPSTSHNLDLDHIIVCWSALNWGMTFLHFIINILYYRTSCLVILVQSYRIICKFEFQNIFEKKNYHKIVSTAITHSSHNVKAIDSKTGKITEKLSKQNINRKKLLSLQRYHRIYFLFGWMRVWYCSKQFMWT